MADLLQDLKTYIVSQGLADTSIISRDTIPDMPDTAIAIYEYQGSAGLPQVASYDRSLQIVVRDKSLTAAKTLINSIFKSLQTEDGIINLTAERWCMLFLRQTPFKFKTDDKDRQYCCFNLGITTYND